MAMSEPILHIRSKSDDVPLIIPLGTDVPPLETECPTKSVHPVKNWSKHELEIWLLNDVKISSDEVVQLNNAQFDAVGLICALERNTLSEELEAKGFTKEFSKKMEDAIKKSSRTKKKKSKTTT